MTTPSLSDTISVARLRSFQPICALSDERLQELAGFCRTEHAPRNSNPFRLGDFDGHSVYLVAGELKLSHAEGGVEVLVGSCDAACWPLPPDLAQRAEIRAITDVELMRIDDHLLDIMLTWDQLSAQVGGEGANIDASERTDWRTMSGAFRLESLAAGALSKLPPANIDALLRRFERIKVKAGEVVLREGDEGDWYYLIESGRCEVSRRVGGADLPLAELKGGDAFGEEALVAENLRNATVTMRTNGVLLRLGKQDFISLLREPLLKRLSRDEAEQRVAAGALWLDVRFPAEYQYDRLPGAINIPLNEIRNAIGPLDIAKEYIVYCQSGRRSSAAAFILSQHGYRASWLENGLRATTHR
ncbi:MAG: cyclic nucleotide-binding domain-containing protein [Betaproteobacteria bacterium]|uniref:Cyclic nucleotide-binding domain-containing protein n=1 Tax=Candidatus Proximibacter danicus TaxID=2954365 RepID=A0A9D7K1Z3_9PROT|nr:cyclic nucleotide-binding domain-containing protein [Candidatus Proximibacter danicus]